MTTHKEHGGHRARNDTGASQRFVTHDQPHHLDARYIVIGKVEEGRM